MVTWLSMVQCKDKCKIQWVNAKGNFTPDDNVAIAYIKRMSYRTQFNSGYYRNHKVVESVWLPICRVHLDEFYRLELEKANWLVGEINE